MPSFSNVSITNLKTFLVIFTLIILITACSTIDAFFVPSAGSPTTRADTSEPGDSETFMPTTITIQGTVIENNKSCEVDGLCFLRVSIDENDSEFMVIYHYGGRPRCLNTVAVEQGFSVQVGDRVEISAAEDEPGTFTTCTSDEHYIHILS